MSSFMSKKKKYKFQVEICLEELLEVPFVSAVLFAKLRLLDGGNFQDHSSRQEVRDHKVHWNAEFSFPCKMMANASTGVMEKCILRISIRKECKGGRSFTKLGFVDLNLAEYAGAGLIHKKALLEGYDTRHRQDNSMLKFRIQLNMISGDILFKAPSPSLKHKQVPLDETANDQRSDEFSSGSLAGSINSGSSGFGSLPKKRTPLPTELVIGQTLPESGLTVATTPSETVTGNELSLPSGHEDHLTSNVQESGHSRNSSNTSQMSKASGYSSISHSRQSSSGDSTAGHIRNSLQHDSLRRPSFQFHRTYTFPKHRLHIPTTILCESPVIRKPNNLDITPSSEVFHTPLSSVGSTPESAPARTEGNEQFFTPRGEFTTPKKYPSDLGEVFKTPDGCLNAPTDVFDTNFNALQKSASSSVVERIRTDLSSLGKHNPPQAASNVEGDVNIRRKISYFEKHSQNNPQNHKVKSSGTAEGVLRSKSDFTIPKLAADPPRWERSTFSAVMAFLTPRLSRKEIIGTHSTPAKVLNRDDIPPFSDPLSRRDSRAVSMGNLKFGNDGHLTVPGGVYCGVRLHHRKILLDGGAPVTKLAPCESPPEDQQRDELNVATLEEGQRRSSTTLNLNPSSGSIQTSSDTGSLDRTKATYERRKKGPGAPEDSGGGVSGRVEITRVNPEDFIADLLKSTNLEQPDDSAETSGLQLFIAKDGTLSLGNHEVKSQMSTGINTFKQVVMDDR